jgi:hypothetical protein
MKPVTLALFALLILSCSDHKSPLAQGDDCCFCADSTAALCSLIPHEVPESFGNGYSGSLDSVHQPPFDEFSWQSFVALNWPADSAGKPLPGPFKDDPEALRVWESYADPVQVFTAVNPLHKSLANAVRSTHVKSFYMMSKTPMNSDGEFLEAIGYPLIDRNLNFVIYEEKINPDESAYIISNGLQTKAGIFKNAPDGIDLPAGSYDSAANQVGAIELKATWRILDSSDDVSRYYHRDAIINIAAQNSETGEAMQVKAVVGLVGLHIVHKTEMFKQSIWSTFEHVDNTPVSVQEAQNKQADHYSFYNSECLTCPPNTPPALQNGENTYKWASAPPYAAKYATGVRGEADNKTFGTQVMRVYPVYFKTEQVNMKWQKKLQGSVWANYRLVGSQWRKSEDGPPFLLTDAPNVLANTTLETYDQQNASCLSCHAVAKVRSGKDSVMTDFSFLFGHYAK